MNKKFDFTLHKFSEILECFLNYGFTFQTLEDFICKPAEKVVILRHDVDRLPLNSLHTARLEHSMGIAGTYYFRILKQSNHPGIIKEIASLGHEIGYHYEDLSLSGGNPEKAIINFKLNLEYFTTFYPVKTICMHGSPASKWDNRELWKHYSYKDYGIIAEPYFDLNYNKLLYLTDTGRKWNGDKSSVRDKIYQENFLGLKEKLKTSDDIISAIKTNEIPHLVMITTHPQRWSDHSIPWVSEFITQSIKNRIKQILFVR